MNSTPDVDPGGSGAGRRRRLIVIGIVVVVVVVLVVAIAGWNYFYGGTAPDAPSIDNALQQLLPTDPPE